MKHKNIFYFLFILFLLAFIGTFFISYHPKEENATELKSDTIYQVVYDTIKIHDTIPIEKIKLKYITKFDTIIENKNITIPIEHNRYFNTFIEDNTQVDLQIDFSGYKTKIDNIYIDINRTDTLPIIYNTITKYKDKHFNHGFQFGIGYGIINNKPDLFIGYGFQINF